MILISSLLLLLRVHQSHVHEITNVSLHFPTSFPPNFFKIIFPGMTKWCPDPTYPPPPPFVRARCQTAITSAIPSLSSSPPPRNRFRVRFRASIPKKVGTDFRHGIGFGPTESRIEKPSRPPPPPSTPEGKTEAAMVPVLQQVPDPILGWFLEMRSGLRMEASRKLRTRSLRVPLWGTANLILSGLMPLETVRSF